MMASPVVAVVFDVAVGTDRFDDDLLLWLSEGNGENDLEMLGDLERLAEAPPVYRAEHTPAESFLRSSQQDALGGDPVVTAE